MTAVYAEWQNGDIEEIDTAESEQEAIYLVDEYRMAFKDAKRIWMQEKSEEE